MFTPDDRAFLRSILDVPEDRNTWLIYADWLDDRADPRAEFLRLMVARSLTPDDDPTRAGVEARLARLRADLDPQWMMMLDPAPVGYCTNNWTHRCGQTWTDMIATDVPDIRRCRQCEHAVVYCHTLEDARLFASCGQAVALASRIPAADREADPAFRPPPPPPPDSDEFELTLDPEPPDEPRAPPEPPRPWWRFW